MNKVFTRNKENELDTNAFVPPEFKDSAIFISTYKDKIAVFCVKKDEHEEKEKRGIFVSNLSDSKIPLISLQLKEKNSTPMKKAAWSIDGTKIIVICETSILMFSTETGELAEQFSQELSQTYFTDIKYFSEKTIISVDDRGSIIVFDEKLSILAQVNVQEAISCLYFTSQNIFVGTQKGKVLVYTFTEEEQVKEESEEKKEVVRVVKLELVNKLIASGSPIQCIAVKDDQMYVSSLSDNIIWSSKNRPLFAIKSKYQPVYCDEKMSVGFSATSEKLFIHKLEKGKREETQFEVDDFEKEADLFTPDFCWISEDTIRLIVATKKQIVIFHLTWSV